MSFARQLQRLTSYPEGDPEAWRDRYRPLVDEVVEHETVSEPRVSVVVVAWQAEDFLSDCLEHLRDQVGLQRQEVEVILVDNGGNEGIRSELARLVDVEIRMKGNAHLCRARNLGAAHANADVVAFVDDDGLVERDYLRNGLRYFDDPDVTAIRTRIVAREHPYFTSLASHYSRGPEVVEDCLVTEGSSFVRRGPFIEVGGFAEEMSGHEGIDLTFRLRRRKPDARILYVPDVVMHHDYVDDWEKFARKNWRYAGVDQRTEQRSADLSQFMDEYFSRTFDRAPMTVDEHVAHHALKAVRGALKLGATLQSFLQRDPR